MRPQAAILTRPPAWAAAWDNRLPPSLSGPPLLLQAQLTVNTPGDEYEQEADRVAAQVMRMPDPAASPGVRRCACGGLAGPDGECAACRAKRLGLQRRAAPGVTPVAAPPLVHQVLQTPGRPLDAAARAFMEPRFGQDFGQVRVHTDAQAAASAQAVNALAYTVGRDVVFGAGRYAPDAPAGQRLLAHELTHVIQQRGAGALPADHAMGASRATLGLREGSSRVGRLALSAAGPRLQRDLATAPPDVAAPAQPDLTDAQIREAIAFNTARYNTPNIRLIQNLLGGPVTGAWTEDNIVAIAATQEEFGLTKDGKVGNDTFVFLNREQQLEGMSTSTANCLTAFRVIGPDRPTWNRISPTQCRLESHFRTESQFSSRCDCPQFQYRQFLGGHFLRTRGTVTDDIGDIFTLRAGGHLTVAPQEDGNPALVVNGYGHREQPAAAPPEPLNHYFNTPGTNNQPNGCRFENEDFPGATLNCLAGDSYDVEMNFRGEIQRNGTPIQTRTWTAIRGVFVTPP